MPGAMIDPTERFTGAEFEPASDGREADGPPDLSTIDKQDWAGTEGVETEGLAATGEALVTAIERDLLGMDPGVQWTAEAESDQFASEADAAAITDIMGSAEPDAVKQAAIEEVMSARGAGVADAAHHLAAVLTDTTGENEAVDPADQGKESAANVAAEVGRTSGISKDAAAIMVNAMRTNVGVSAVTTATGGLINYT